MNIIETHKLSKFYGKTRGISDLDLEVAEGEFFGIIGPNGAGKSTLIRTLLGLIKKSGGTAKIFGKDITENKKEILSNIGYLPSEAIFYSGMKAGEVIKFSADLRRADCTAEAHRLCERFELDTSKKVEELSYGNRKKLAAICALQSKPPLLFMDEPTGGLDPLIQKEFFDILKERNAEGTTVVFSSHILSEVQKNCSRAAIIRSGKIVACGDMETLSETGAKRVKIQGNADISSLSGIKDLKKEDGGESFLYGGDINSLIGTLAAFDIKDLTVSEPDLEEIFMHYYTEGGDEK